MRKKSRYSGRPKIQCGICKIVVETELGESGLQMVNHSPDTGEKIPDHYAGCIGLQFPNLAKLVLNLQTEP